MRILPARSASAVWISLLGPSFAAGAPSNPPSQPCGAIEDSSWYAQVSEGIRQGEYAFHPVAQEPGVWSATNRSHALRCRVSRQGLEVFPRAANADGVGAAWRLSLSTRGFGRLDDSRDLGPGPVSSGGGRVVLDHGGLQEWFENGDRGIEQGWTIGARPRGVEPLWIGIDVGGDLDLRIEDSATAGALVDASGAVRLHYRGLHASDATGRGLCASLRSSPSGPGIQIDDEGAVYPVTVDPVLTGPAWTAESDQAQAFFGGSVSTAGDVNGDGYGDVIVGAYQFDNGETDEGRAYLFLGSATGLSTSPAWTAESNQASAMFGYSVSRRGTSTETATAT